MGIEPRDFDRVWRGIDSWLRKRGCTQEWLARTTQYPLDRIRTGISGGYAWISTDFVHDSVYVLGVSGARIRNTDGSADGLLDEECVDALTSLLP